MSAPPDLTGTGAPIELFGDDVAHLRGAAGWARFLGVVSFALTGLLGLGSIAAVVWRRLPIAKAVSDDIGMLASLGSFIAAAVLMLAYDRKVRSFLAHGDPALAQAFRSLRRLFQLWTLYTAFEILMTILSLLGKR
jgi:hypothetical protein